MPELLLELLSEEIPARMQARAADDLKRLVCDGLKAEGLTFDTAEAYVTPRRLTLVVDGLPERQPDVKEERKGPQVGAPEKAMQGFLKSTGLSSVDECEIRDVKGKQVYFVVREKKGQPTPQLLPELFKGVFQGLPWPKSMRWGGNSHRWVRPLDSVLCVFDGRIVDGIAFGDEPGNNMTKGHRFLFSGPINNVSNFADYKDKLRAAKVMLDPAERRMVIREQAEKLSAREGLSLKQDEALLNEVAGLVEWPVVMMGSIDEAFMDLPPEVLITSMRHHQKYFSLLDESGDLAPRFIMVSNMEATDGGKAIVAGNERVLRARLADAKFFWDQDRKTRLEDRLPELEKVIFHAKLGTVAEKTLRMEQIAAEIAPQCGADKGDAMRAAKLCKADLVTEMVVEFTDLQGIMGRYYALNQGEKPDVAQAIADHYSPAGPHDYCPIDSVSIVVSLADKLDTLVGFFAIDEKPTGSKDPFALRRAALGIIRLILENSLRLHLRRLFTTARDRHRDWGGLVGATTAIVGSDKELEGELLSFFADRLKVHLREQGVRHDLIDAVFALGEEDDLVRILARVDALGGFLNTDDGANLLVAYRRAANILRIEEKKDNQTYGGGADAGKLTQDEEKILLAALNEADAKCAPALLSEDFAAAMSALATLRGPVDAFFDHVTVNCDDPDLRVNRLRLLSQIRAAMDRVADFSRIEGGER